MSSMYRTSLGMSNSTARRTCSTERVSSPGIGTLAFSSMRCTCAGVDANAFRRRAAPPRSPRAGTLEALESALARVRDLEEGVELRQLEKRLEVIVEIRESQLTALLTNLLRQRDEDAQPRAIDVSGLAEVDQELALPLLELVQHLLLQLLPVADDELPLHVHDDDIALLPDREAHVWFSRKITSESAVMPPPPATR